ncbi:MAG: lipopolysaccharide assembly LapA domain-containing protein [Acidiferrobacterales bacterium]
MKKYFYVLISIVVLLFGFTLTLQNRHPVDVNYYFGLHWHGPLAWILFAAFAVGVLAGFLASLRVLIRMQRQLVRARKDLRRTEQEVTNLRALPINDVI